VTGAGGLGRVVVAAVLCCAVRYGAVLRSGLQHCLQRVQLHKPSSKTGATWCHPPTHPSTARTWPKVHDCVHFLPGNAALGGNIGGVCGEEEHDWRQVGAHSGDEVAQVVLVLTAEPILVLNLRGTHGKQTAKR
jgi:hypothetical protein